jgi:general secretion pathway protein G
MIGMTLIELLSGVAIVGVLASVAFGAYAQHVERVRFSEAVTEIQRIQLALAGYANRPDRLAAGLPDDLSALGLAPDQLIDPWGRAYQYVTDSRMNRDYDLFSLGKDGLTSSNANEKFSADDIVRASNGAFVGAYFEYATIAGTTNGQFATTSGTNRANDQPTAETDTRFTR